MTENRHLTNSPSDLDGIPGWYNVADSAELAKLARLVRGVPGVAVEFGSFQGRSAAIIQPLIGRRLHCVDVWPEQDTLDAFERHTSHLDVAVWHLDWREWLTATPDPVPIAFCHVDADHSYREVHETITRLLPRMAEGGILCGHDYGWPNGDHAGVTKAVDELLPERRVGGSVWSVRL